MQNVEYKAELQDLPLARTIAASIGALHADTLEQTDTYYRVPDAKLKKRETVGHATEWVFYSRPDRTKAKLSTFTIYPEHMAMERFGSSPLPIWTIVKKKRELWTYKGVRVHLDSVEGLGHFLEFEALVCPERNLAKAHELIESLTAKFRPALGEPIACGYADLLAAEAESEPLA